MIARSEQLSAKKAAPHRAASPSWAELGEPVEQALREIAAEAKKERDRYGNYPIAKALEWAAARVREALDTKGAEELRLPEASARSGFSKDHLARLVRQGKIPDIRPLKSGPIRIRVRDLPIKPIAQHITSTDALGLASASNEAERSL